MNNDDDDNDDNDGDDNNDDDGKGFDSDGGLFAPCQLIQNSYGFWTPC